MTRLQTGWSLFQSLADAGDFSVLQNIHTSPGTYSASYLVVIKGPFAGVKWLVCEVEHRPPSVWCHGWMECNYISILHHMPSWHGQGQFYFLLQSYVNLSAQILLVHSHFNCPNACIYEWVMLKILHSLCWNCKCVGTYPIPYLSMDAWRKSLHSGRYYSFYISM